MQTCTVFAGNSHAVHEPFCQEQELKTAHRIYREPLFEQSASLTTEGGLWAKALGGASQEPAPVTPFLSVLYINSRIANPTDALIQQVEPQNVIELLEQWMGDCSGHDENTWPELKRALDEDRLSNRRLFNE